MPFPNTVGRRTLVFIEVQLARIYATLSVKSAA
jgi:hypothetical protein